MGGSLQGRRFQAREETNRRGRRGEASLEGGQAAIKAHSALQRNSSRCFFLRQCVRLRACVWPVGAAEAAGQDGLRGPEIQTIQRQRPRSAVASRGLSPVADRTIPSISLRLLPGRRERGQTMSARDDLV